jgi:hypothetical protein
MINRQTDQTDTASSGASVTIGLARIFTGRGVSRDRLGRHDCRHPYTLINDNERKASGRDNRRARITAHCLR